MSSTSKKILGDLTQNYLWMTAFKRRDERDKLKSLRETEIAVKTLASAGSSSRGGGGNNIPLALTSSESTLMDNERTMLMFPSATNVTAVVDVRASSASTMIQESQAMQPIVAKLQTAATQELTQGAGAPLLEKDISVFRKDDDGR